MSNHLFENLTPEKENEIFNKIILTADSLKTVNDSIAKNFEDRINEVINYYE